MVQHQEKRNSSEEEPEPTPPSEVDPEDQARRAALAEETDDLLDEIDSVLEENSEEFVRGYVQKGGE